MLISVIITCYNQAFYIDKCIKSVVEQIYSNLQIIIVDDGSTDASGTICDEYARKDNRIKVIHKKNGGVTSARKVGLEIAEGKYVNIVDGDDYLELNMYKELIEILKLKEYDFVQCDMYSDKGDTITRHRCVEKAVELYGLSDKDYIWKSLLDIERNNHYVTPNFANKLIKRELAKKVCDALPLTLTHSEDFAAVIDLLANYSRCVYLLPLPLYHYVWRKKSHSNTYNFSRIIEIIKWYNYVENILRCAGLCNYYLKLIRKSGVKEILDVIMRSAMYRGYIPLYYLEKLDFLRYKRVILYGAGQVGKDYFLQINEIKDINIVAWIDKNKVGAIWKGSRISPLDMLKTLDYDYIIIAVRDDIVAMEIIAELAEFEICKEKIVWNTPKLLLSFM